MSVRLGGMSVWMKALLTAHGDKKRRVWLFDTYAGIPKSVKKSSSSEEVDNWSNRHMATKNQVRSVFMRYGLLDTNVKFVRGTFHDTLSTQAPRKYSLIRFDGDTYESTVDALELAYSRLAYQNKTKHYLSVLCSLLLFFSPFTEMVDILLLTIGTWPGVVRPFLSIEVRPIRT